MEWLDRNVGALEGALQQTPEVFASVGVNLPIDIPLGMVDNVVDVVRVQAVIREQFVGVDIGAAAHVLADVGLKNVLPVVSDYADANGAVAVLAVASQQALDRDLADHAGFALNDAATLANV